MFIMKKIIFSVACALLISGASWAQNAKIESQLDATKSSGFLKWENTDNLGYKIRVFKKSNTGELTEVFNTESMKNFVKLEKELLKKDHYYRIDGKSTGVLDVVTVDDIFPIPQQGPGFEFNENRCYAKCNGPSYSWQLRANENMILVERMVDGQLMLVPESTGTAFLTLASAPGYYDSQGQFANHYMMMDFIDLTWYKDAYFEIHSNDLIEKNSNNSLDGNWDYFYVSNLPINHGYRDLNGSLFSGTSGYLVKKSLFKYDWMSNNRTNDLPNSTVLNLCGVGATSVWTNTFNNASGHELNNPFPSTNTSLHAQNLNCIQTPLPGADNTIGDNDGDNDGGKGLEEFMHAYFDCVQDFVELDITGDALINLDCFKNVVNPNGNSGNGNSGHSGHSGGNVSPFDGAVKDGPLKVVFTKVNSSSPNPEVVWTPKSKNENPNDNFYLPDNLVLQEGLYLAQFIFRGMVIPIYFESTAINTPFYKISDFVSTNISPNPIQGGKINLDVVSAKKIKYTLYAFNLNGEIIHTEQGVMNEGQSKNIKINVNKKQIPFNQVRVKLKFEDGSTLEKIALM
jgi:hypothetical protein